MRGHFKNRNSYLATVFRYISMSSRSVRSSSWWILYPEFELTTITFPVRICYSHHFSIFWICYFAPSYPLTILSSCVFQLQHLQARLNGMSNNLNVGSLAIQSRIQKRKSIRFGVTKAYQMVTIANGNSSQS